MTSTKIPITIEQGATFHMEAELLDANNVAVDVSPFTGKAQIRQFYDSNTSYDFAVTLETGKVSLDMNAATTSLLSRGRYLYDVYLYASNTSLRIIEGTVLVTGEVTV